MKNMFDMTNEMQKGRFFNMGANNMCFRAVALALSLVLLSGCSMESAPPQRPAASPMNYAADKSQTITLPLHFYAPDEKSLKLEKREVKLLDGQNRAELAVQELINGPTLSRATAIFMSTVDPGIKLRSVQVSGDAALVDLGNSGESFDLSVMVKARTAIANTLIDLMGVGFVNVYFNGSALSYQLRWLDAMPRFEGNPENYLNQIKADSADPTYPMNINVPMYFPDANGKFLVCEVHTIEIKDSSSGAQKAIINEWMKGPYNVNDLQPGCTTVFGDKQFEHNVGLMYPDEMSEENETATPPPLFSSGKQRISVSIFGSPTYGELSSAALVCTLMSIVPEIAGVDVTFNQTKRQIFDPNDFHDRLEYLNLVADLVTLYAPVRSEEGGLRQYRAAIAQNEREKPAALMGALIDASANEKNRIFPKALGKDQLIEAYISGDTAVVNFKGSAIEILRNVTDLEESQMIYAVVNTLTEISGINQVQFLFDGQPIDQLRQIVLTGPLLKNPGVIIIDDQY